MRKLLLWLVLLPLSISSIISCNRKVSQGKTLEDILSNTSCNPPCWIGITPNATTVDEARQLLMAHPDMINQESIFNYVPTEAYRVKIGWQAENSEISGTLYFKTELLDHIYIRANEGKMKLADGIQLYGVPEKVVYEQSQCKATIGDSLCLRVYLYYPNKGLELSYEQLGGDYEKLIIDPNQQIDLVHFFDPDLGPYSNEMDVPKAGHTLNWPGYAEIDIKEGKE